MEPRAGLGYFMTDPATARRVTVEVEEEDTMFREHPHPCYPENRTEDGCYPENRHEEDGCYPQVPGRSSLLERWITEVLGGPARPRDRDRRRRSRR